MSEDKKDFNNESIDDILKDFQAKRESRQNKGEKEEYIPVPVAPPKKHIDFSKKEGEENAEPKPKKEKVKKEKKPKKEKVKNEKKSLEKFAKKFSFKIPIIIVLIIALVVGAVFGIGNAIKYSQNAYLKTYQKKYPSVSFPSDILEKYCDSYGKNSSLAGYIKIKDINLDSSVYAKKTGNKPYIERSVKGAQVFNNVVYLNDNSLESFYSSADSYNNNATGFISYSDLTADYNFKVVAAYYTNTKAEDDGDYIFPYNVTERQTPQSALDFLDRIKNKSLYSTGITVTRGDTLLTVSCPTDFHKDFRFVVVGVARKDDKKLTATPRSHIFYPQVIFDETGEKNYFNFTAKWYPTIVVGNKTVEQTIKDYE